MRAIREGVRWFLRSGLRWAILALLIVAFLWFVPQLQGEYFSHKVPVEERPALVNEYRRTWAQIIGGFGLLLGLYFTYRRVEISERTLKATQDQQVTERFTRAIDQLGETDDKGNPRLEIRLGGIYALERIAKDSPERDYSTVMEVLTAYVRENAPLPPKDSKLPPNSFIKPPEGGTVSDSATNESPEQDKGVEQHGQEPTVRRPRADIQAILDVLNRREEDSVPEHRVRLDLREALLQGANLQGANLQGANLQGANLYKTSLQEAYLREANLQGAFLREANLRGAFLQEAHLYKANLQDAKVTEDQLADVQSLQGATMPDGSEHP